MTCGLLGQKLVHSYSPQIHNELGNYSYELFEVEPEKLEEFLLQGTFTGINVTIPYKKAVIPYCTTLSTIAQKIGAVNTIVRCKDGTLHGHNTDYFGFHSMLEMSGLSVTGKKVLVLGSGGASVTVTAVLKESGANVIVISRSGVNNYTNLHLHHDASVIVNTTPVGMYPNTGVSPLDLSDFPTIEGVLDVIYNPARTQLLLDAEKRGLVTMNGLWMLVAQAKESAELFMQQQIPNSAINPIYEKLSKQMANIVLIGMPGSGKTTIGKLLAQHLNRVFIDIDAAIEETANMPIPAIFETHGEDAFRELETAIIAKYGKCSSLVISTGGGCVTKYHNYPLLHQNSTIYCIERSLDQLATEGRPLSANSSLAEMFHTRQPLYKSFADCFIQNNASPMDAVNQILKEGKL